MTLSSYISHPNTNIHKDYDNKTDSYNAFVRRYESSQFDISSATPLAWAPIAIKDNILLQGQIASCGSKMLQDYQAPYTATCAQKLLDAWAHIIGHTNMDEFAMGSSGETSFFWPTTNPLHTDYVPGGSSSGSAAAVAWDLCLGALGSDTWWSIRQPAAFCGIVGVKPTYGRVSRYGVQAMASSLDQVGTLTQTVADAALLLDTISGYDPHDAQSKAEADQKISLTDIDVSSLRFAVPQQFFGEWLAAEIKESIQWLITKLRDQWATIDIIDLPVLSRAVHIYYVLMPAEASTNLQRFDGIKYGQQRDTTEFDHIKDYYKAVRSEGFGEEVKRRILLGTYALSSAKYEELYQKAQWLRQKMISDLDAVWTNYDCILWPTTPTLPWKIWGKTDPLSLYLADTYTIPANLTGLPAVSVPTDKIGDFFVWAQIMTPSWQESRMLSIAQHIEKLYT